LGHILVNRKCTYKDKDRIMLPQIKSTAIAWLAALSIALGSAAPVQALGKNERNLLKGLAATLIIGAILNDANNRAVAAPRSEPRYQPRPEPRYELRPEPWYQPRHQPRHEPQYRPREEHPRNPGRVVGSSGSVAHTVAAQTFNTYGHADRRAIQTRLRGFGYYTGRIDGAFGPATYRAIVAYARDSGGSSQLESRAGAYGVYDGLIY